MCPNSSDHQSPRGSAPSNPRDEGYSSPPHSNQAKGATFLVGASVLTAMLVVAFPCSGGGGKKKSSTPGPTTGGDGGSLPVNEDAYGVIQASSDVSVQPRILSDGVTIDELGGSFEFVQSGWYAEYHEGGARMFGAIQSVSDPDLRMMLDVSFSDHLPEGELGILTSVADRELTAGAYVDQGGSIDPNSWTKWEGFSGTLEGMGTYRGLIYEIELDEFPVQVGNGANGRNTSFGMFSQFSGTRVQDAPGAPALATSFSAAKMHVDLRTSTLFCADGSADGRALTIGGLDDVFVSVSRASFVENIDGTAVLRATLAQRSSPKQGFQLTLTLNGRISGGSSAYPPTGSPMFDMTPSSYVSAGGDVDTEQWRYYRDAVGQLEGLGGWEGADLTLNLDGPAAQVGFGASGDNTNHGLAARYQVTIVDFPTGDVDFPASLGEAVLRLDLPLDCGACPGGGCAFFTMAAEDDAYGTSNDSWTFELPGIGEFTPYAGGTFTTQLDDSARLTGVFVDVLNSDRRFHFDVILGDKVESSNPNHGDLNPILNLDPSAYVENGGPADPSQWTFWRDADAVVTGLEDFAGALYFFEARGFGMQFGVGANGRNVEVGGFARFTAELQNQAASGPALPLTISTVKLAFESSDQLLSCANPSIPDASSGLIRGASVLSLGSIGATFVLEGDLDLRELDTGRAKLTATFVDSQDSHRRFVGRIDLAGRVDPGTLGHPPRSSPEKNLEAGSYVDAGGPVDPASWTYYQELYGSLHGEGDFAGAHIVISRQGPSFQVGLGATDENLEFGGSGGFQIEIVTQPNSGPAFDEDPGLGRFRLVLSPECD
ncbi:MAG: hypothetical protein ACI835_000696 [Planctomycetota bacterium]|jgi:hypothetical protein